ncbi:MAG: hypothetical protein IPL84_00620 [Chitinophagaceae bacterium]|nr:hypothetical protein [Chitinophagaceae bacterium]
MVLVFLMCTAISAQAQDMVQQMYAQHAANFRYSLSFVQETNFYRNDSLHKTDTGLKCWYIPTNYG